MIKKKSSLSPLSATLSEWACTPSTECAFRCFEALERGRFPVQCSGEGEMPSRHDRRGRETTDDEPHAKKNNGLELEMMTHLLVDWILVVQLVDQ